MALVNNLIQEFKSRNTIHKSTECNYYIVRDISGKKYLQIDTFGSEDREFTGKVSQSIQFSPDAIKQLKQILEREF